MQYVCADVHGEADRFHKMLETIEFSENDTLYIIGDVIDRGRDGVDLLFEIMSAPNMRMIRGNHEQMLYDCLGPNAEPFARQLWMQNGGSQTRRELLYHLSPEERREVLRFIREIPTEMTVSIGGSEYLLVHGYPHQTEECRLWDRVEKDSRFADPYVIVGHTPTPYLTGVFDEPYKIFRGDGFCCIDCGCGNLENKYRRLACLRLDDMEEFYV